MKLVPYSPELHEHVIEYMLHLQGHDIESAKQLPFTGYVAEHEGTPIAAAFLRCAEGAVGIFDGLVSNPESSSVLRHQALDMLIEQISNSAYDLGIRRLLAFSTDGGTISRAQRLGFKKIDYVVLSKEL